MAEGFEGKYFSSGCEQHFAHIFAADAKAASGDACYDLIFLVAWWCPGQSKRLLGRGFTRELAGLGIELGEEFGGGFD